MKIRQMHQILEVYNCKSINKAAQNLYISPSSLLASINAAEEELGDKIFVRSYLGIAPTDFGKEFIQMSNQILDLYSSFLLQHTPPVSGKLHVSGQHIKPVAAAFAQCFSSFSENENNFRYHSKTRGQVCQDVINGTSDLGFITTPTESREAVLQALERNGLSSHIICTVPFACMVGPKNPLYHGEKHIIKLKDLAAFPRLCYEWDEQFWAEQNIFQGELELFPHQSCLTISDSGSFQDILSKTNSYFIGTLCLSSDEFTPHFPNLRNLEIEDVSYTYDISWIQRKHWKLTPIARTFLRNVYVAMDQPPEAIML